MKLTRAHGVVQDARNAAASLPLMLALIERPLQLMRVVRPIRARMKQLADGKGALLEEPEYFGTQCFLAAATLRFPELGAKLKQDPGVHIAMSVLSTATMEAARVGDLRRVHEFYAFLTSILDQPRLHPEIPSAIAISYVVISQLRETVVGSFAVEQMPSSIRELISSGAFR